MIPKHRSYKKMFTKRHGSRTSKKLCLQQPPNKQRKIWYKTLFRYSAVAICVLGYFFWIALYISRKIKTAESSRIRWQCITHSGHSISGLCTQHGRRPQASGQTPISTIA